MTFDPLSGKPIDQNLSAIPVTKVLFVDSRVPDLQSIMAAAEPGVKIVVLDANQDGVQQMASALQGMHGLESIGVVSHGDEGVLLLGNGPLFAGNMEAHQADLSAIGAALGPDGDILFYGCDVGRGDGGSQFLAALATATGADVAASSDSTGDAGRGGDWNLEITTGTMDGAPVLDVQALAGYHFLLHTASVSTVAQLKTAIATGNTDGSADIITLTGNITFASAGDAISINVTDGQTMSIVGGGFTLDAAYYTRALTMAAGSAVVINNLTIMHGAVSGNGGNSGSAVSGGSGNGGAILNAGTLTLTDVGVTQNIATGGGGGGGVTGGSVGGGGGGGSGAGGHGGGNGGDAGYLVSGDYVGVTGGSGSGGHGGGYQSSSGFMGGGGGTGSGGAGGVGSFGYSNGGAGATASAAVPIGGGGGGSGWDGSGGTGGGAAGAIYNTGTLTILGTSAITNNIGAAGGGGGGGGAGNHGGVGGLGVGAIWNAGGTVQITSTNYAAMTGNVASSGSTGSVVNSGSNTGFTSPTAVAKIYNGAGTVNTNYSPNPTISSVNSSTTNGSYKVGDTVSVQVNFSEAVTVTGTPELTLETGTTDRVVNYASGSGTSALTFTYTVQAGDTSADLDYQSTTALALNSGTIKNGGGFSATLTLAAPGAANSLGNNKALVIDGVAPTVTSVNSSTTNGTYKAGDTVSVQVNFSEAVTVTGTPQLTLETGTTNQVVNYASGSGTSTLTFTYTVQAGDTSADLDYAGTSALALNGGTIKDTAGNGAILTLAVPGTVNSLGANKALAIDGVAPASNAATVPANGTYVAGQNLDFSVSFDEAVTVNTGGGDPRIALTLDTGGTVYATYLSGSGSNSLTFRYTTALGNLDTNGIAVASNINLNGGTIKDAAGNNATVSGIAFASTVGVLIDGVAPAVSSINRTAASTTHASSVDYAVTFSENVTGVDASDFALTGTGTANGAIASVTQVTGSTYTVTVNGISGDGTLRLDLKSTGTGIVDGPGNAIASGFTSGQTYTLDNTAPAPPSTPDLSAGSDSGSSSTDNLTNAATPTFTGTAESGSTVTLYDTDGTTVLGTATATGGNWAITSSTLAQGAHTVTAKATDTAGNASVASSSLSVTVDATAPTLAITSNVAHLKIGETATITFTFSEDPGATFTWNGSAGDVVVTGGTLGAISGAGLTRTATFTPTAATNGGTASITVASAAYTDTAGNNGGAGTTPALSFDTLATNAPSTPGLTSGSDSGASNTDRITNVTTPTFTGTAESDSTVTLYDTDGTTVLGTATATGGNWSITSSTLAQGAHTVTAKATDAAGNVSSASSALSITVDATAPAAPSTPDLSTSSDSDSGSSSTDNLTNAATPTFTGTAESGSTVTLYDTDGTTVLGTATATGGNWSITSSTLAQGAHTVTAKASDTAGNASAASSGLIVIIDATAPTASIVIADTALKAGAASLATITFSEAVTGFTNTDLTVDNGTLSAVSSSDGGITWTATLTPTAGTTNANNAITLTNAGVSDGAGNAGTGTTSSNNYAIDTAPPAVSSVAVPSNATYTAGQHLDFTVNWSEAVTVDTTAGSPRLAVTLDSGGTAYAAYQTGSGTSALTFRLTVTAGQIDLTGIALAANLDLHGATLRDAIGNNATLALNGVPVTSGVLVNAPAPDPGPGPVVPPPPSDGDNIPNAVEDIAPGLAPVGGGAAVAGDGNGDGIADSKQAAVTSVSFLNTPTAQSNPSSAAPVYVTLVAGSAEGKTDTTNTHGPTLNNVQQLDAPANLPAAIKMPIGLIAFTANVQSAGALETFSLYVDPALSVNGYWKQNTTGTWVNLASAAHGGKAVLEGGKLRLDFSLTDGGEFDADGKADGVITDPGAAGFMPLSIVGYTPELAAGTHFWF